MASLGSGEVEKGNGGGGSKGKTSGQAFTDSKCVEGYVAGIHTLAPLLDIEASRALKPRLQTRAMPGVLSRGGRAATPQRLGVGF